MPTTKAHECVQGPLCEEMTKFLDANQGCDDPMCAAYGCYCPEPTVEQCDHVSCSNIVHQPCEACFIETMDAYYADADIETGPYV